MTNTVKPQASNKISLIYDKPDLFKQLKPDAFKIIASQLNQRDKYDLLRASRFLYDNFLPLLYDKVVIITNSNGKNVRTIDFNLEFEYPTDRSLISSKHSMKKFFKTVNRRVYSSDKKIKFAHLMNSFHCYYSHIPKGFKIYNFDSYTIEDVEDTFTDCFDFAFEFDESSFHTSNSFCIGVLRTIMKLTTCEDIYIPSLIYSKLFHNMEHYDYIMSKSMRRGVDINLSNWLQQIVSGQFFIDMRKTGLGLRLSLANLTSLRISFADPFVARKIINCCDVARLRSLTLDHMNCQSSCHEHISDGYRPKQLNRKFLLIDEFFKNPHIINLFKHLHHLELVCHNGYNRSILKKFLISLNHFSRLNLKGAPKLNLKSFVIRETTNDFSRISTEADKTLKELFRIYKREFHNTSSFLILIDLLQITETLSIFDVIDFTKLSTFKLYAKCFPNFLDKRGFRREIMRKFDKRLQFEMSKTIKSSLAVRILVDAYDHSVMVPRAVICDED